MKDRKMKALKARKKADEAKSKLAKLQTDHEAHMKSVEEVRVNLEKEGKALCDQVAELQNSLK